MKVLALIVVSVVVTLTSGQELKAQIMGAGASLARLTADFVQLKNEVDNRYAVAVDRDTRSRNLGFFLDNNFPSSRVCGEKQFRCGNSYTCISAILACDGSNDCPNGEDEARCEAGSVVKVGTVYKGYFRYNECMMKLNDDTTFEIKFIGYSTLPYFTNQGFVDYLLRIVSSNPDSDLTAGRKGRGKFNFGTMTLSTYVLDRRALVQTCQVPPGEDRVMKCSVQRIGMPEGTRACAEILFFKQ